MIVVHNIISHGCAVSVWLPLSLEHLYLDRQGVELTNRLSLKFRIGSFNSRIPAVIIRHSVVVVGYPLKGCSFFWSEGGLWDGSGKGQPTQELSYSVTGSVSFVVRRETKCA